MKMYRDQNGYIRKENSGGVKFYDLTPLVALQLYSNCGIVVRVEV